MSHQHKVISTGRFQVLSVSKEEQGRGREDTTLAPTSVAPSRPEISTDPLKVDYAVQQDLFAVSLELEVPGSVSFGESSSTKASLKSDSTSPENREETKKTMTSATGSAMTDPKQSTSESKAPSSDPILANTPGSAPTNQNKQKKKKSGPESSSSASVQTTKNKTSKKKNAESTTTSKPAKETLATKVVSTGRFQVLHSASESFQPVSLPSSNNNNNNNTQSRRVKVLSVDSLPHRQAPVQLELSLVQESTISNYGREPTGSISEKKEMAPPKDAPVETAPSAATPEESIRTDVEPGAVALKKVVEPKTELAAPKEYVEPSKSRKVVDSEPASKQDRAPDTSTARGLSFPVQEKEPATSMSTNRSLKVPSSISAAAVNPGRSIESDITIYGATSSAALHVITYLMQASLSVPGKMRITLAGRNRDKLDALHKSFTGKIANLLTIYPTACGRCDFDVFLADSSNANGLKVMASRAKLVLNCAGPFAQYGSNVVAACAQTGSDYVDITGEITWGGEMRLRYSEAASKSGARIISFCGFDSIPSDIAVFAAVQALREASTNTEVNVDSATTWNSCFGFPNGGTVQTALGMPLNLSRCLFRRVPFLIDDPLVLTHPRVRVDPEMNPTRDRMAAAEWTNQLPMFHSIFRMGVSAPFLMAPVNTKIVNASAIALKYGPNFVHKDRFLPTGFKMTTGLGALSLLPALMSQIGLLLGMITLKLPVIGKFLANLFAPAGSGVTDELCMAGYAEVYAEVTTSPNKSTGRVDRANCFLKFEGDPGNWVTAQCISEAALALIYNRDELPPRSKDGFGTPAELLGTVLLNRLQNSTVRPVSVRTHVRKAVRGMEWRMFP